MMNKNYRDLTIAPFSFLTPSLTTISITMLCLLIPQILLLLISKAFSSVILIAISIFASVCAEFTSNKIRHTNTIFDFTAVVQGLFIGMFIPQNYPMLPVFFIVFLSLLMVKYIFGGNAESWINPVAYTVIIIYFLGISFFPEFLITKMYLETGNPGMQLIQNGDIPVFSANVREPFGMVSKLLISDFSVASVLWGIDGDWMVRYMPENNKFYPTDHCGVLRVKTEEIDTYYLAMALDIVGQQYMFSRTNRASIDRIEEVKLPIPPKPIQDQVVEACQEIDAEFSSSRMTIDEYREKIKEIFIRLQIVDNLSV